MFFTNEKSYKALASGLRRELKAMGVTTVSHNQMLEAIAKGMGHKSYAALLAAVPAATAAPAVAEPAPAAKSFTYPVKPIQVWGYAGERDYLAELEKYAGYRLFNTDGKLDLATKGDLVDGIGLNKMGGTSDDILNCIAHISGGRRDKSGKLYPEYTGDTKVNWDDQKTRKDTRGVKLYLNENFDEVPADKLIIAPELPELFDDDDVPNLLSEELAQDFPVRQVLIDACRRWLVDKGLVARALEEMHWDADWNGFGDEFVTAADAIAAPDDKDASVLGQAQWVAGFAMHVFEFKKLRLELLNTV